MKKIGEKLYRWCKGKGVWSYTITAIRTEKRGKLYELSSDSCDSGFCSGCTVLVKIKDLSYVDSYNGDGDSDMWHEGSSKNYYETRKEAELEMLNGLTDYWEKDIKESEIRIQTAKEKLEEIKKRKILL